MEQALNTRTMAAPEISIVVPMMNEEDSLDSFFARLLPVLAQLTQTYEIVIVNDGSRDATLEKLTAHQKNIPQLVVVDLSRNFGKEAALTAGFSEARGEAVIVLDADLQDPPELILQMVEKWQAGYEVVAVVRKDRSGDRFFHRANVGFFYKFINMMSDTKIKPNVRDYRLMCRAAVDAFLSLKERTRFNKGLFAWLGFREYYIYQELHDRVAGSTKWNFRKLFSFAIDGITSFSTTPTAHLDLHRLCNRLLCLFTRAVYDCQNPLIWCHYTGLDLHHGGHFVLQRPEHAQCWYFRGIRGSCFHRNQTTPSLYYSQSIWSKKMNHCPLFFPLYLCFNKSLFLSF